MTNYSENPGMVRVDYWKESGKWYMTEAVDMSEFYETSFVHDAVSLALTQHWTTTRSEERKYAWQQFIITVTEPYHKGAYPIMIRER